MTPALRLSLIDAAIGFLARISAHRTKPKMSDLTEADSARRTFISEVLETNGDAFCSEYDVQAMMSHFPGRF